MKPIKKIHSCDVLIALQLWKGEFATIEKKIAVMQSRSINCNIFFKIMEQNIIKMSEVTSKKVDWLWFPFIPFGKLTIIQGDPGEGKTTLVLNLIAKLSNGLTFKNENFTGEPISVIYQSAEDGLEDTVKPRLEQAGANCSNIYVINESNSSLSIADGRLEDAVKKTGAKVLILDPLQAYIGTNTDINRANETRSVTKSLCILAEKYNCAIILVGHMNKSQGSKAAYRGIGSIDIFAVARSVILVGRIPGKNNIRGLVQIKNNLSEIGKSKAFELSNDGFKWIGDFDITEDEILNRTPASPTKLDLAKTFVTNLLDQRESISSKEIYELAQENAISRRTLERAKEELHIDCKRSDDHWIWTFSHSANNLN